jgi:hypothetical protein
MTSLIEHRGGVPGGPQGPRPAQRVDDESPIQTFTLRRTGRRPLRFQGWQMVEAAGYTPAAKVWYDINIYQTVGGAVVVEAVAHRAAIGERDVTHIQICSSLGEAAEWLEGYSPATDVAIAPSLVQGETPLALAALQAVQLRQRMFRIEEDYRVLVSEVLAGLDVTEQPTVQTAPAPANRDGGLYAAE